MTAVHNIALPHEAEIIERIEETPTIFTLRLRFTDPALHRAYSFQPGQFNMLYLPEVGEVPISIVSDPEDEHYYDHTIRIVGRVTRPLAKLQAGDRIGVRGPYGRGWPAKEAEGKDVVIATGGLGCAPVVAMINYILRRRERFGHLTIMQGVRHSCDLIWKRRYEEWEKLPNTKVLVAANQVGPDWRWKTGHITACFDEAHISPESLVMMCGPEPMMIAVAKEMLARGVAENRLYLSMERNMQCGFGKCGHCQMGEKFVCKDGPVFSYDEIKQLLGKSGF